MLRTSNVRLYADTGCSRSRSKEGASPGLYPTLLCPTRDLTGCEMRTRRRRAIKRRLSLSRRHARRDRVNTTDAEAIGSGVTVNGVIFASLSLSLFYVYMLCCMYMYVTQRRPTRERDRAMVQNYRLNKRIILYSTSKAECVHIIAAISYATGSLLSREVTYLG